MRRVLLGYKELVHFLDVCLFLHLELHLHGFLELLFLTLELSLTPLCFIRNNYTFNTLVSSIEDLAWLVDDFSLSFSCIFESFLQSASLTFSYLALRYIYCLAGLAEVVGRGCFFLFLRIVEAWVFTYWVSFFENGSVALR